MCIGARLGVLSQPHYQPGSIVASSTQTSWTVRLSSCSPVPVASATKPRSPEAAETPEDPLVLQPLVATSFPSGSRRFRNHTTRLYATRATLSPYDISLRRVLPLRVAAASTATRLSRGSGLMNEHPAPVRPAQLLCDIWLLWEPAATDCLTGLWRSALGRI